MTTAPSQFAPFAEIMRDGFATPKPELKDGSAIAVYYCWWPAFGKCAGFAQYNLTVPVAEYPKGATVGIETLNRLGYSAPDMYASRSTDDAGELTCT